MDNVVDVLPAVDPAPQRPNRKAWKEKNAAGRNRTGKPIPPPATEKEAKELAKVFAADAIKAVVEDKKLDAEAVEKYAQMSSVVRAHILSYLGEDIDAAKAEFARELLANARLVAQHIMGEFESYPPSVKTFWFTALTDKAEAVSAKAGALARNAQVAVQINQFMGGEAERDRIIAQLTGQAFQPEPIPVTVGAQQDPVA